MLFKLLLHSYILCVGLAIILSINVNHVNGSPEDTNVEPSKLNGSNSVDLAFQSSSQNGSSAKENCESRNSSCAECVKSKKCFYCYPTSKCLDFSLRFSGCSSIKETAYGTCLVKSNVLAIALGSVAGVVILGMAIACCCCCRCQRKRSGWEVDNQKENLTMRASVIRDNAYAREERQKRVDEIKRKYGIPDKKYNRF